MGSTMEDHKRRTEEQLLASDNLTEEERRRIKRRASNRESARRTRHKRTERLRELEDKKAMTESENAKIVNQVHELEKIYWDALLENRQLKSDIQSLRAARPDLSALCPSSLSTMMSAAPPLSADFLNMTMPMGFVPPAMPLSLNSDSAGVPAPHEHLSMPNFGSGLPGLPGLSATGPGGLSLPPPMSSSGLPPPAFLPPGVQLPAPGQHSQSLSELMQQGMSGGMGMNFTSMLESAEGSGDQGAQAAQAALAALYSNAGLSNTGLPPGSLNGMKAKDELGDGLPEGLSLPPPSHIDNQFSDQMLPVKLETALPPPSSVSFPHHNTGGGPHLPTH